MQRLNLFVAQSVIFSAVFQPQRHRTFAVGNSLTFVGFDKHDVHDISSRAGPGGGYQLGQGGTAVDEQRDVPNDRRKARQTGIKHRLFRMLKQRSEIEFGNEDRLAKLVLTRDGFSQVTDAPNSNSVKLDRCGLSDRKSV